MGLEYYPRMSDETEREKCSDRLGKPLYLWFAYPTDALTDEKEEIACVLSDEERSRCLAFRFEQNRREYLTTRLLVRNALSRYYPLPPRAWHFQVNRYGKPAVDPDCGLRFNISNSPELVVCLIGTAGELGIDAEPFGRASQIAAIGGEFLSSLELTQLDSLSGKERLDRTLSLWTLKESYIKARGLGLSLPLCEFSFVFDQPDGIRLYTHSCLHDYSHNWRFCLLDLAGHRVALFVDTKDDPQLEIWEHTLSAAPIRRPADEVRWFRHFVDRDPQGLRSTPSE